MKASVTLLIPTLLVMRSRRRNEATTSLRFLTFACVQVPVRKFPERLPTTWGYLIKLFLLLLSVCLCIEICPSHTIVTFVEAPYYVLHPPLPASKTVLSSWGLVVTCALIDTGVTGVTAWHDYRLVVPDTRYQALYTRAQQHICTRILRSIEYVQPEHHLFAKYWYHVRMNIWIHFHCDVPRTIFSYMVPGCCCCCCGEND